MFIVPTGHPVQAAARIGAEEAKHTAQLVGRNFELTIVEAGTAAEAEAAARGAGKMFAIAGGMTKDIADAIARASAVPFLEIRSADNHGAPAGDGRFRLTPPAVALRGSVTWHPRLSRYGAGELNERFLRKGGLPMDSDAWTAWLAMKLIVEAALREREIGSMRIDGHKGVPLRFNAGRVLQQPVYRVDDKGEIVVP